MRTTAGKVKNLSIVLFAICVASCTPPAGDYPPGIPTETPGIVLNPVTGKKIDVKGLRPGSLVKDPNTGHNFRVPPATYKPSSQPSQGSVASASSTGKSISIKGVTYEILAERQGINPFISDGRKYNYKLVKNPRLSGYEYKTQLSKEKFMNGRFLSHDWLTAHDGGILVFLDAKPIAKVLQREEAGKFVKNPWTGKIMEVTGLASGKVAKDPKRIDGLQSFVLP